MSPSLHAVKNIDKSFTVVAESNSAIPGTATVQRKPTLKSNLLGLWGVLQVILILFNAIKRLLPVALIPFHKNDLSLDQWVWYGFFCLAMGYTEGYKAFQLKFSPMAVSRAFDLIKNPSIFNYLFAGPYCMGLFNAPKKRMILSWSITAGVLALVKIVKYLPYPYRSIVDAGVVVGLSYGALSIVILSLFALMGRTIVNPDDVKDKKI
jgi:hypothetical protein